jgi:hypothetical protein
MAARHCQWHCVNVSVSLARLYKNVISSDFFIFFKIELLFNSDASGKNDTLTNVFQIFS